MKAKNTKPDVEIVFSKMTKKILSYAIALVLILININSIAQTNIPVGTWRTHISFRQSYDIAIATDRVYSSSKNGIFYVLKEDNSLKKLTKMEGLSDTDISEIAWDSRSQSLLSGYKNGNIDIIRANAIINYPIIKNSDKNVKTIFDFTFSGNLSYVATGFGVVVFDLERLEIIEAYQNLGETGENLQIFESVVFNDSLFLATEKGVIAGRLDPAVNLQDFNNWFRFDSTAGIPQSSITSLTVFDNKLYAAISEDGIYTYGSGMWNRQIYLQNEPFTDISVSNNLMTVSTNTSVWTVDVNQNLTQVISALIVSPGIALIDTDGSMWIADAENSLVSNYSGEFQRISPSGPYSDRFFTLFYNEEDEKMTAVPGGYDIQRNPIGADLGFYIFEDGLWTNFSPTGYDVAGDMVDITYNTALHTYLLTSFGNGITFWDGESNIRSINLTADEYPFPVDELLAVYTAGDVSWLTCYEVIPGIYKEKNFVWEPVSLDLPGEDHILQIKEDLFANIWFRVDPVNEGGLLIYNETDGLKRRLTDVTDNGGLPENKVYDIEVDLNGNVWIATGKGVAYYPVGIDLFSGSVNAIRPIYDGRFLLGDEKVTVIKTDGGNRKWIGTEKGVWLFDEFGEELIYFFSASDDPLLSDEIIDIEINDKTGEVFIATSGGLSSFRGTATKAGDRHAPDIKIFPNPVGRNFSGLVAIEGLAHESEIKITDVAGNLIWQMHSNGGTATWNLTTLYGGRPGTGIYLIFSSTSDGTDTFVGKLAIID